MSKINAVIITLILIMGSCYPTSRVLKSKEHLFENLNYQYPLNQQPLYLITTDKALFLKQIVVTDSGEIEGTLTDKPKERNFIRIILNSSAENSVKLLYDSSEKEYSIVHFSDANVQKITYHKPQSGRNQKLIYDKNFDAKLTLEVIFYLFALGVLLYLFFSMDKIIREFAPCYIATMVYGSVEASEVILLRRYRDETLSTIILGRIAIWWYYLCSPTLVKIFKNNVFLKQIIKYFLDKIVDRLRKRYHLSNPKYVTL